MVLALPWLHVTLPTLSSDVARQLARAAAKFVSAPGDAPLALRTIVTCDHRGDPESAPDLIARANARFQFVHGVEDAAGARYATVDGSIASVDHESRTLHLALNTAVFDAPYSTWADLFAAPLAATWRHHGYYPVHGAAVSFPDQSALLVVGASGSGKTTTALALAIGGGTWRSDDKVLLHECGDQYLAASLYANTNLAPPTIAAHDTLAFAMDRPPINDTNDKRPCLLTELGHPVDFTPFTPTALLFPRQVRRTYSTLRQLEPMDTLVRLAGQSPTSGERGVLRRQHECLVSLARRVPAWELEAGRDVLQAPAMFTESIRMQLCGHAATAP